MIKPLISLIFVIFWSLGSWAASPSCLQSVQKEKINNTPAEISVFKPGVVPQNKEAFLKNLLVVIDRLEPELQEILLKVNNVAGAKLEFNLIRRQLGEELGLELYSLLNTPTLENIAVYASTNVPLYTLVSHGFMAKTLAKNVWFRTPETTRDIYVQLFEKIKSQMPEGSLDGLNLLTESRDVQYDNFNKMYVMGMNKKGTRVLRPPSEMVIFTGNPHTAKKILESNQAKLHEDAVRLGFAPFKQVFLGFGAGINPIVVVPSAKTQIQKAVYSALEPVRINNGQDCLAADFIAVDKRVADSFIQTLMSEISQLQPGSNKDVHAGYTPLTMNKNFDQLKAYREKYSAYLLNPEAVLDENTRLVSPHVFVFPYSMFKNVEIREHFAPFFTVFKFEGDQQLEKIMRDERVQDKTMYASVLGGPRASPDLDSAIQILRQTRHSVIVNDSLFGDLHANMPYGGRGASTSLVVNTSYDPQAGIQSAMGHRPKLVSHEAYTAFGKPTSKFRPSLLPRSYFEQELYHLMKAAEKNPLNLEFTSSEWKRLKDPFLGARPRGLVALQELIQKEGFHIVVDQGHISKSDAAEFKEFFGAEALVAPVNSMTPKIVPGVLFHPSSVGQAVKVLNRARGSANPHLGWGNLHGIFDSNKYAEYILTEAVKPGIMAPTETLKALKNAGVLSHQFQLIHARVIKQLNQVIEKTSPITPQFNSDLIYLVETLFQDLRAYFPEGAYLKNFGEFGTADMGTQVTTFSTPAKMIVSEYLRRLADSVHKSARPVSQLKDKNFEKLMGSNTWEMGTRFIHQLLTRPDSILVQSRVKIAKTPMGFPMEMRVDFVDGESILSRNRFSYEYLPQELKEAAKVLNDFFKEAPQVFRYMSGGADLAKLADGSWIIIEFNVGSASGTLHPGYFTFEYHQLISNLKGERTPWLKQMDEIYSQGMGARIQFMKKLKNIRPLFWKGYGLNDLSVAEVGRYYRDLELQTWTENPTSANAEQTLNNIKNMLAPWKEQENIRQLILSSEVFIKTYKIK